MIGKRSEMRRKAKTPRDSTQMSKDAILEVAPLNLTTLTETIKCLEENTGEKLFNIGLSNDFFKISITKAQTTKTK